MKLRSFARKKYEDPYLFPLGYEKEATKTQKQHQLFQVNTFMKGRTLGIESLSR